MLIGTMARLRQLAWRIVRSLDLGLEILRWHPKSLLRNDGWYLSFRNNSPQNLQGEPIPWLTYPFIYFLEPRIHKYLRVFEYGCGNSTIWFAKRVGEIISIEHNQGWAKKITEALPTNGKVILSTDPDEYPKKICEFGKFDIILIDGLSRDECSSFALTSITNDGVIILDNSNRNEYIPTINRINEAGYKGIMFHGLVPGNFTAEQTTVFYRSNNCLGI